MAQVYRITEQCSGKSFECEAGQSVLKAMEQRGMKCVPEIGRASCRERV